MAENNLPHGVTVVIPTINRADVLVDTLSDMLSQRMKDYEIVIVDQSEEINQRVLALVRDGTEVPVRYFKADFRGLPQARNFGWRHATKDIVLYIDDDIRTDPDLVRRHFECHIATGADMVAGGIDESKGNTLTRGRTGSINWWTATAVRNFQLHEPGWCFGAPGGNFSVRTRALRRIGGFDEALAQGAALYEETELALRLRTHGYRTFFEPSARLLHLAAPMGGCRVTNDWPKYMHGLAHNRAILIFRHLRWWYRPTAIVRLFLLGVSYSRKGRGWGPLAATARGLLAGYHAAAKQPINGPLEAALCSGADSGAPSTQPHQAIAGELHAANVNLWGL